jgi:hypothetical protein
MLVVVNGYVCFYPILRAVTICGFLFKQIKRRIAAPDEPLLKKKTADGDRGQYTIPEYYGRVGWRKIGMDEFKSHPVTVMEVAF